MTNFARKNIFTSKFAKINPREFFFQEQIREIKKTTLSGEKTGGK